MVELYVWGRNGLARWVRRLSYEESGLSGIEYGVFAAFIVLALVAVAGLMGPQLKNWIGETMCNIMGKTWTAGAGTSAGSCS